MSITFRKLIFLTAFFFPYLTSSQTYNVAGKVIDSTTRQPLAFVNVVVNDSRSGTVTDIDGKFRVSNNQPISILIFSYVGYKTLAFPVTSYSEPLLIRLTPTIIDLAAVEIFPGINPAHRIILNAIDNRDRNDPEKMQSFSYTSYDKMYFTADIDTISKPDTLQPDSGFIKTQKFFREKNLFLMETVSERKFLSPDRNYEKVVASRVSGFKDPMFVFLISQMQSTSFYKELIKISDKNYVNPISRGSINKYFFDLADTLFHENSRDTTYVISYRPFINTNFDGLKGLLYINTNGWAIENVIAEPAREERGIGMKIQQMYELADSSQWFPVQLNTDIILNFVGVNADSSFYHVVGIGKSYIRDILLNPDIIKRQFSSIEVDVDPMAFKQPETFWKDYRIDSLSIRDKETYRFIDSIGDVMEFDRIARTIETLMTNKIPYKFLDIDINKFFRYNDVEGFYFGLGAHTNQQVSRHIKIGGYWGYAFRDKTAKYGGDISCLVSRNRELEFGIRYINDVAESGGTHFFDDYRKFRYENLRDFLVMKMDRIEVKEATAEFRMLQYMKIYLSFGTAYKKSGYGYYYGISGESLVNMTNQFNFTQLSIGFRYAYKEKFLKSTRTRVSLGTDYPIMWFNYTRGFKDFLGGEFTYDRFDLKIQKSFYIRYIGKPSVQISAGLVNTPVPCSDLYSGNGSYQAFTIFAPNSFATMRLNEFLSDRYIALYFTHDFGKLLYHGVHFNPEPAIAFNMGFGWLKYPGHHYDIDFKTMEEGYFETGFLINHLLDVGFFSVGLGTFYRLGPYTLGKIIDNFAFKVTLRLPEVF
jgi:hypothetical protein